ncbi:hypothetical protein IG631_23513 [Alternaria alternata]|nr:hypothetical protein IG631_23513 [Alternaria alternata]
MDIRVLRPSDIPHVQLANITNLPENYFCKYYLYHAMSWPQLSYVAVDVSFVILILGGNGLPLHGRDQTHPEKGAKELGNRFSKEKKKTRKQLNSPKSRRIVSAVLQLMGEGWQ